MKLFHYGKPIIVCKNTSIDRIVEEEKLGLVINYNVQEFFQAVDSLKGKDFSQSIVLYKNKYSWTIMEERLQKIFKE